MDHALRRGVPRSTARGWLASGGSELVTLDVFDARSHDLEREVIVLRNFCGMDYEPIARELGVKNEAAARALHSRAVARLRELVRP